MKSKRAATATTPVAGRIKVKPTTVAIFLYGRSALKHIRESDADDAE